MHKRRHHVSLSLSHTPHASLHPHRQSSRSSYMFVRWARRVRAPDEHWSARERISPPFPDTVTQIQCRVSSVSKFSVPLSPHSTSSLSLECSPTERIRHHTHRERERDRAHARVHIQHFHQRQFLFSSHIFHTQSYTPFSFHPHTPPTPQLQSYTHTHSYTDIARARTILLVVLVLLLSNRSPQSVTLLMDFE